jgi:hypothetical protein
MANEYTIILNDTEKKAMEYITESIQEWVDNALKNRARIAIDQIYDEEVIRMTADPDTTSIPADKDTVVLNADIVAMKDIVDSDIINS